MSDGRDRARWNDPPCWWCSEKDWCRKDPPLPPCRRLEEWLAAGGDESALRATLLRSGGRIFFAGGQRRQRREAAAPGNEPDGPAPQRAESQHGAGLSCSYRLSACEPGPTGGHWGAADWLFCRDGKWRPVEPGTFPLAHGAPARVGRLRGYGNSINAIQAEEFIKAYMAESKLHDQGNQ